MKKETLANQATRTRISSPSRRQFLGKAGSLTAATIAASAIGLEPLINSKPSTAQAAERAAIFGNPRRNVAFKIRQDAAIAQRNKALPRETPNNDEYTYDTKIGNYSKGLPHNQLGQVELSAYGKFQNACQTGRPVDFEAVPMGGTAKQVCPQSGLCFVLEGGDLQSYFVDTVPAFNSEQQASEIIELYWQALTRDIPFREYNANPLIAQAAAELSETPNFRGAKMDGKIAPETLFRGETSGDLRGPYISQFLWKEVPSGPHTIIQKYNVPLAGDFMTSYDEWLRVQRGFAPTAIFSYDPTPHYIRNGRDLGGYVHKDYTYQAFLYAALILLSHGAAALDEANPYKSYKTQTGFSAFGAPDILDMVTRAANAALKAAWYQKWYVHRRVRPEAFAGHLHNHKIGAAKYDINAEAVESKAAEETFKRYGTYLLPMAYPEGSPLHPAYPSGHAAIAGACATILKAFFNESFVLPNPVEASADGLSLHPYNGALTVGDEVNKLAANIAFGRNTAGVHWRTDAGEGIRLGEQVAIRIMEDMKECYNEDFKGYALTKFSGIKTNI